MLARLVPAAVVALGLLALAGCGPGKLNESRNWDIDSGEAKAVDLPAIAKPQTVKVEFTSSDADVTVYVFKEADAKGEDGLVASDPSKALAKASGKTGSFTADVPENTATRVIVRNAPKKTKVDLKITNQQK
jgi:hypothetical protein